MNRPPFLVPPENLNLWDKDAEEVYNKWKSKAPSDYKGGTGKNGYREYLIDLNDKYNMEETFDQLETGLLALEKLLQCMETFPSYNLEEDLEFMYKSVDHTITKEFIKKGVQFVRGSQTARLSQCDSSEATGKETLTTPPDAKDMTIGDERDLTGAVGRKKVKKKKKRRGQKRLIQFQVKLVKGIGLPPSRLMRVLAEEFDEIGGAEASSPEVDKVGVESKEMFDARHRGGEIKNESRTEITKTGFSSGKEIQSSLCSSSLQSSVGESYTTLPVFNTPSSPTQYALQTPPLIHQHCSTHLNITLSL